MDVILQADDVMLQPCELFVSITHLLRRQENVSCKLIHNLAGACQRIIQRMIVKMRFH